MDIENPAALLAYLRETGRIAEDETPGIQVLAGGVSNRTVLVSLPFGEQWVLKQALGRLRVQVEWLSPPERIEREALGMRWLARLLPAGSVPELIFEDPAHHLIAMSAVLPPHRNWKAMLLEGAVHPDHIDQFAGLLAAMHHGSRTPEAAGAFDDRSYFESLRLEPYYDYTAAQVPAAAPFLRALIAETRATRLSIVHGDFSPKNILVHGGRLILLDHEVIHFGDPAFDLGFSLTHLLAKANHVPNARARFAEAALRYWNRYRSADSEWSARLEPRAVRHTLACLLARVDGRSPLEYLTPAERDRQRSAALAWMAAPPLTMPALISSYLGLPVVTCMSGSEILDSRGRPTVRATCELATGARASVSVPSGASTGEHEAVELRDGDPRRYRGLGCRRAAAHVSAEIHHALAGRAFESQAELDRALIALDGTPNKFRLGANAILAASIAFARARAAERGVPLYRHFADIAGIQEARFPQLTINLFSGGKHAGKQVAIQDVLLVPASMRTIDEALAATYDVYQSAAELVFERYGMRLLTADEGGLAPPFETAAAMIEAAIEAIQRAGYEPGRHFQLAIDVASSHFYVDGRYTLDGRSMTAAEMIALLEGWVSKYPIVSIEDGLAENDWDHWPHLLAALKGRALVLGDDLLCTNPARIRRAVSQHACNALLLKVNQIGTLTEAAEALRLARSAGWAVTVSVRSGETEDDWAADLAVGWAAGQFKNGSITQSERLAKYNRLLELERAMG